MLFLLKDKLFKNKLFDGTINIYFDIYKYVNLIANLIKNHI